MYFASCFSQRAVNQLLAVTGITTLFTTELSNMDLERLSVFCWVAYTANKLFGPVHFIPLISLDPWISLACEFPRETTRGQP